MSKDYYDSQPKKMVSAAMVLLDERGRLLIVRTNYGARKWGLPAGW